MASFEEGNIAEDIVRSIMVASIIFSLEFQFRDYDLGFIKQQITVETEVLVIDCVLRMHQHFKLHDFVGCRSGCSLGYTLWWFLAW